MSRRPGHYVPRTGDLICEQIATGKSLRQALQEVGYLAPTPKRFWRWIEENQDFREKYERARMLQADTLADRMLEMHEEVLKQPRAASAYKVSGDILRWQAEVRNRARYGAKSEEKAKPPMDAAKMRDEIKRLQKELGVIEDPAKSNVTPLKREAI